MTRLCSVEGCGRPHKSKGYCGPHAERVRAYGDPRAGEPIKPNGQHLAYLRSIIGTTETDCIISPFGQDSLGYAKTVVLNGRIVRGHVAVTELAHGPHPRDRPMAAHSCGKGQTGCVNPNHLRWATGSENAMDKLLHGTSNRRANSALNLLTEDAVRYIRKMNGVIEHADLARAFGLTVGAVRNVLHRSIWGHVDDGEDDVDPIGRVPLSREQRQVMEMLAQLGDAGMTLASLRNNWNFSAAQTKALGRKGVVDRFRRGQFFAVRINDYGRKRLAFVPPQFAPVKTKRPASALGRAGQ